MTEPTQGVRAATRPIRGSPLKLLPETTQDNVERLPREWTGSNKYNRVGQIGKGAFATVYKVTSKFDGKPYAAKELDKRKFMKNGVLDQKVENEMNIMQKIEHVSLHTPRLLGQDTDYICSHTLSRISSTLTGMIGSS